MNITFQLRHSKWYEQLLFSRLFQLLLGFFIVVILPAWISWPEETFNLSFTEAAWYSNIANTAVFLVFFIAVRYLRNFPGAQSLGYILPMLTVIWLLSVIILFFFRLEYVGQVIFLSYLIANIWVLVGFFIRLKYRVLKLAVVPVGEGLHLTESTRATVFLLDKPDLQGKRYDAVVADLHSTDLNADWKRFLAKCALSHLPIFNYKNIEESLTGRVQIEHLSENEIGSLLPSKIYSSFKLLVDIVFATILLPFLLPVMLVTAIFIKLDSKGPALFIQERVGYRGKSFKVYKFRSMRSGMKGKDFTDGENDPRITRVGRVIRKYRLDELPQLFNVLKGNMSFIGPRPESKQLSNWYEKDVPFFTYRHVVRPGISGWAQVNQGYAAEVEGMITKLQYDFYYIKHFSLSLDILIVFKTIHTVITGFGAR